MLNLTIQDHPLSEVLSFFKSMIFPSQDLSMNWPNFNYFPSSNPVSSSHYPSLISVYLSLNSSPLSHYLLPLSSSTPESLASQSSGQHLSSYLTSKIIPVNSMSPPSVYQAEAAAYPPTLSPFSSLTTIPPSLLIPSCH